MTEHANFLVFAEKRRYYVECLQDLTDYIDRHTESIKRHRMGNLKGIRKIIKELMNNVDKFVEEGDFITLVINDDDKKKGD